MAASRVSSWPTRVSNAPWFWGWARECGWAGLSWWRRTTLPLCPTCHTAADVHTHTTPPRPAAAKLAVLVKHTRQAKEEVERALSAKLGRRINVMGEVNQLLV